MAGCKRRLAPQLWPILGQPVIAEVVLIDPGEWGRTLGVLFGGGWEDVAKVFDEWADGDARELFDRLRGTGPSTEPVIRAATHLFLQSRTFMGKPVWGEVHGWRTYGFDPEYRLAKTSAPNAHPRGWCNTRSTLAKRLRALARLPWPPVTVHHLRAQDVEPVPGAVVYMDPEYRGTLVYGPTPNMGRDEVVALAQRHAAAGCDVVISEAEPIAELGWSTARLAPVSQRRLGAHEEWVTYRHAACAG